MRCARCFTTDRRRLLQVRISVCSCYSSLRVTRLGSRRHISCDAEASGMRSSPSVLGSKGIVHTSMFSPDLFACADASNRLFLCTGPPCKPFFQQAHGRRAGTWKVRRALANPCQDADPTMTKPMVVMQPPQTSMSSGGWKLCRAAAQIKPVPCTPSKPPGSAGTKPATPA